jgi:CDP-diacylglycerol--glycerol-3-phosphate 3-phosphatidyltransferase
MISLDVIAIFERRYHDLIFMKYVPNALTIARIVVTPVMLILLMSNTFFGLVGALALLILGAISDYLDGKIARSFKAGSRLGQFLDPLADKVLVLGTFVVLAILVPRIVPWWAIALIALRDVAVTVLRSWIESRGRSLRTLPIAKAKTGVQLGFLIALLGLMIGARLPGGTGRIFSAALHSEGPFIVLLFVVAFTLITGIIYLVRQEYSSPVN